MMPVFKVRSDDRSLYIRGDTAAATAYVNRLNSCRLYAFFDFWEVDYEPKEKPICLTEAAEDEATVERIRRDLMLLREAAE